VGWLVRRRAGLRPSTHPWLPTAASDEPAVVVEP